MKVFEKVLPVMGRSLILGLDVEWTKNYQVKNGNKAFCFSVVSVAVEEPCSIRNLEQDLTFGFHLQYVESEDESRQLCHNANTYLHRFLSQKPLVVGHQFSTDISVLLACGSGCELKVIELLQHEWRTRQHEKADRAFSVFDTRYDLSTSKSADSNKLVNVCREWKLAVEQPEIKGSMTLMQRNYYASHSSLILEKIAVMNIRHSLSSILLYLFHLYGQPTGFVNINTILHRNIHNHFEYVNSPMFHELLSAVPV
jgi:hypothetical protein